jgi:propionyl-CoA synthetase
MGRIDDVINVAGHRLSTGEMEEILASHPDIAECAVVGIDDALRGQRPIGFVVLKDQVEKIIATSKQVVGELSYEDIQKMGGVATLLERVKVNIVDSITWTTNQKPN